MSLVSPEDPILQRIFRKFAADGVEYLAGLNALPHHDVRPEPGTQDQTINLVFLKEGLRMSLVTEWRTKDLTRHFCMWELESGELILDIVYAEGDNEVVEQLHVDDLWLASVIEKAQI